MLKPKVVELSAANVTSNVEEWDTDLAIMFYSPTCKYCRQLAPSWDHISILATREKEDLVVGKFNCESNEAHAKVCADLLVDRYPSVYFIGYGNFNQAPEGNPFAAPAKPSNRVARFSSDLYPEAIYDWVRLLAGLSTGQRRWDGIRSIFSIGSRGRVAGSNRDTRRAALLQMENDELRASIATFEMEAERRQAKEVFDSIPDSGDPWPLLSEIGMDEQNLPFRVCIAELASEYCKFTDTAREPWCLDPLPLCAAEWMAPQNCRPEECPFVDKRGCNVVSSCLKPEVISEYQRIIKSGELKI